MIPAVEYSKGNSDMEDGMRGNPAVLRIALLLAAAAVVPACGSSSGGALTPGGGVTLFSDGFATYDTVSDWTVPVNVGVGATTLDGANGNPAGSLSQTGGNNDSTTTTTQAVFASPSLTVRVDVAALSGGKGTATVSVSDGANTASAAWNVGSGQLTCDIDGTSATVPSPAVDGVFHTLRFSVDGAGNATWTLDGGAAIVGPVAWPNGNSTVTLGTNIPGGGATPAVFNWDNVRVTTP
jgi:hypothetical protein